MPPLETLTNSTALAPSGKRLVVETAAMRDESLGRRWAPSGLAIADIDPEGNHTMTPITKDAKWPAWGR